MDGNYKFGFVILHYLSLNDTRECIKSIIDKISFCEYLIVVVDNCSPNRSGETLLREYDGNDRIIIYLNTANAGFSSGNNIGINIARERGCDFVIVLNNDTLILQEDFCEKILLEYNNSYFSVLGPRVYDPQHYNGTSPLIEAECHGVEERKKIYLFWKRKYIESIFLVDKIKSIMKKKPRINDVMNDNPLSQCRVENVPLHGCCLIFSPNFFEFYDGFEELTFMYGEETILKMNCDKYNLLMVYNPNLKIFHKEAVSTKKSFANNKSKTFYYKRMMLAAKAIYMKVKGMYL